MGSCRSPPLRTWVEPTFPGRDGVVDVVATARPSDAGSRGCGCVGAVLALVVADGGASAGDASDYVVGPPILIPSPG